MKKSLLYTRTGDNGTTSLADGTRAAKDDPRLEAYGTVDELNSWLGLLAAEAPDELYTRFILEVQNRLFDLGGYLATPGAERCRGIGPEAIAAIEREIDRLDSEVEPMRCFVLPGGTVASSHAQIARTVCRRAERRMVTLAADEPVDAAAIRYVNRLSDWAFAYARRLNAHASVADIPWTPASHA